MLRKELNVITIIALTLTSILLAEVSEDKNVSFAQEIVAITLDPNESDSKGPADRLADEVVAFSKTLDGTALNESEKKEILEAIAFAAKTHHNQYRRNYSGSAYLSHPIDVALVLIKEGHVTDPAAIKAAILHDSLDASPESKKQLKEKFGEEVSKIVEELTFSSKLSLVEKKRLELENSPKLSYKAKLIKLSDRIVNLRELKENPPPNWNKPKINAYLLLSDAIFTGLKGTNSELEKTYQKLLDEQFKAS